MTTKANFPVTAGSIVVPYGHVIGNEKWRGSEIAQRLQGKHKLEEEKQFGQSFPLYCSLWLILPGICFTLCLTDLYLWCNLCQQAENYFLSIIHLHGQFCHTCIAAEHCREGAEVSTSWEPQQWDYCEYASPLKSLEFTQILGLCYHLMAQQTKLR